MIKIKQIYKESIHELIDIYDSANLLFDVDYRAPGTYEIFDKITDDETFILYENEIPAAFISYHVYENYVDITGLYVRIDYQKKGYGRILLRHVESRDFFTNNISDNNVFILSALKKAVWAVKFYESNGYSETSENMINELGLKGISFNNWSIVMIKIVDRHKGSCCCHCENIK